MGKGSSLLANFLTPSCEMGPFYYEEQAKNITTSISTGLGTDSHRECVERNPGNLTWGCIVCDFSLEKQQDIWVVKDKVFVTWTQRNRLR